MNMKPLRIVAMLVFVGSCADSPTAPEQAVPGVLTLNLTSPFADDRAIVVRVRGPAAMSGIAAGGDAYVVHARAAGDSLRAAAFGALANGPLLRFSVPDVRQAGEYHATVVEASDPDNALRADVSGYVLTVTRP
jgi:hypothetical protein